MLTFQYRILTHSKSCFAIRIRASYRILTFEILFWNSNWGRISHFDIRNPILGIRIRTEYRILAFEILFWHSNWSRISNFDIRYLILTFELGPNIEFWHSAFDKLGFRMSPIRTCQIGFRMSKCNIRPQFECQNRILNVKMWYSVRIRLSKWDFECQHAMFGPNSNVQIWFRISKCNIWPEFECENWI